MTRAYPIVIEHAGENYSAFAPDLPGCVATGETAEKAHRELMQAIDFHLAGLKEDGLPVPAPYSAMPQALCG